LSSLATRDKHVEQLGERCVDYGLSKGKLRGPIQVAKDKEKDER